MLPQPFELVRKLRALQDRTAHGDKAAYLAQRDLIAMLAQNFATVDRGVWQREKNARAALIYVLSGGNQRVVRHLLAGGTKFAIDEALLKGALAYSGGRYARAAKHLEGIDPRQLDASFAGQIALAKSVLSARRDPAKAARLLDFARITAPGTLIEESALRREVILLASAGEFTRMEMLAGQYLRRFSKSIYADGFLRHFMSFLTGGNYPDTPQRRRGLAAILGLLDADARRRSYLSIAGQAAVAGKLPMARFAARRAARLAIGGSTGQARANLYEAAALVVTKDIEKGLAALNRVNRSNLNARDGALHGAVLALAGEVTRLPAGPVASNAFKQVPVMAKAEEMIAEVDKLLGGARR